MKSCTISDLHNSRSEREERKDRLRPWPHAAIAGVPNRNVKVIIHGVLPSFCRRPMQEVQIVLWPLSNMQSSDALRPPCI